MNPCQNDGDRDDKNLKGDIKMITTHLHNLQVPVDDWWEYDEFEGRLHK